LLFVLAVVSPAIAKLTITALVSLHHGRTLRKHYEKLANLDLWGSRDSEA
jgi:hypothetical protein